MPYIGIEYHIEDDSWDDLTIGFREFIAGISKGKNTNYNIIDWTAFESGLLDKVIDSRLDEGKSRGKLVLHKSDGTPVEFAEADTANRIAAQIREFNWKDQRSSSGSIKSLNGRSLKSRNAIANFLKSKVSKVDQEEVEELITEFEEKGFTREEAREAAVQTLESETPSTTEPSPRKGVPVRDRALTSGSTRPWERTEYWRMMLDANNLGPKDVIPDDLWRKAYNKWNQTTDKKKEAQKAYQEGDRYKGIQSQYNLANTVGKDADLRPDGSVNPRRRYLESEKGQTSRQASQMRVKGRMNRADELAKPFRDSAQPVPEYEIALQLFREGWYPEAMDTDPATGILKPLSEQKFSNYYFGTSRKKGSER